ncbi:hypothetical protein [Stenotrophomonas maltophilia]|uniref:hypothetical protein n=1 Tax=Stenotrophomonas maltophilia TaxID=40324 RepID=UPI000D4AD9A9|nr:hypothetical protein [Stenotrophomonas maltophilia]MCF3495383.1 hypothetical protein [Stenotrophomonas maltophilia]PSD17739.1 hypothetical protein C7E15_10290 [Stenotrophomonas maltophilia]
MNRDLFDSNPAEVQPQPAGDLAQRYRDAVAVDVIHRSQVGACIPFTPLPKHYLGKKVRIVIVGEADE